MLAHAGDDSVYDDGYEEDSVFPNLRAEDHNFESDSSEFSLSISCMKLPQV